jgi:hypothetical protein
MTSEYAPFPEQGLLALAEYHERLAAVGLTSSNKDANANAAKTCRDALAAHAEARESLLCQITDLKAQLGRRGELEQIAALEQVHSSREEE